jgi:hypothetical protein
VHATAEEAMAKARRFKDAHPGPINFIF